MLLGHGLASMEPDEVAPEQSVSIELAALRRELDDERRAREALAEELALLLGRAEIAPPDPAPIAPRTAQRTEGEAVSAPAAAVVPARGAVRPGHEQLWFDRGVLDGAGLSSSEIQDIERRWEEHEMDMLYLVDRSKRDRTFGSPRYAAEIATLKRELREDLGPERYDALLYATGKNNRVKVREVLANSPAGYAGLETGDLVISYVGQRVFHSNEFKASTTAGEAGVLVSIEVERGGEFYRFRVPRGPLGIRMSRVSVPPLRDW